MTRVVLANEMGGGMGAFSSLRAIANEFIQRGCNVLLMCRDCEKAARAFGDRDIAIEQSPAWKVRKTGFSLNYAQCIWGNGYWDEERFRTHVVWWKKRFRTLRPDYVLTDYAPTALLAAMSLDLPRSYRNRIYAPRQQRRCRAFIRGFLCLRTSSWNPDILVERIGKTLPSIQTVEHIFSGAQRYLIIFPETDHYEGSRQEKYWGPVFGQASDRRYIWPEGNGPKTFLSECRRRRSQVLLLMSGILACLPSGTSGLSESDRRTMESDTRCASVRRRSTLHGLRLNVIWLSRMEVTAHPYECFTRANACSFVGTA